MPMTIEQRMTELMNEIGKSKHEAGRSELARYYAILFTDIEKAYAFYMLYLYPNGGEVEGAE